MTEQQLVPGLVGMSVHTDCAYLKAINAPVAVTESASDRTTNRLRSVLRTIDFKSFLADISAENWSGAERHILAAGVDAERAGADFLLITSNTGNTLAGALTSAVDIPLLDIARPSLIEAHDLGLRRLGLLSTTRTADAGFYQAAAAEFGCGLTLLEPALMERIQKVIFADLVHGVVTEDDVDEVVRAAEWFERDGADGVLLACTDLTLLTEAAEARSPLPLLDTTALHAAAAARVAAGVLPLERVRRRGRTQTSPGR